MAELETADKAKGFTGANEQLLDIKELVAELSETIESLETEIKVRNATSIPSR